MTIKSRTASSNILWDDTGCNPEDLPEAMNDRETWRESDQRYPC